MMFTLLSLLGCPSPTPQISPTLCTGSTESWVQRTLPLMWGRRPHGAHEVRWWTAISDERGRDFTVRVMATDPQFQARWRDWLTDRLAIDRTGDREFSACFAKPAREEHDGGLTTFLREQDPQFSTAEASFNMADVLADALVADDLSVVWRAHLFAQMARPLFGANVGPIELEHARRFDFGENFFETYLHRDLSCLPCHNSEFSVTGSSVPEEDRTWEVPGRFERALWGDPKGLDPLVSYSIFRTSDLVEGTERVSPWGWTESCGTFSPPSALRADLLGSQSFFIEDWGESGSVWDLERLLDSGIRNLAGQRIRAQTNGIPRGEDAFAYLVGQSIADAVWKEATGSPLTIAHNFPRNQAQRDRLQRFTDTLVTNRFSLVNLLVAVTADPYFNPAHPDVCGAETHGMEPVFNPWSPSETEAVLQGNGIGDRTHRLPARTLIRSAHHALGWRMPDPFLGTGPLQQTLTDLGAFTRKSQPGFDGTDFQGLLAFEALYGSCEEPDSSAGGCVPQGGPGCVDCACEQCVCFFDSYCCDTEWDETCAYYCGFCPGGCGGAPSDGTEGDVIDQILTAATSRQANVGEVVAALKDRLVINGTVSPDEEVLIEELIGVSLSAPVEPDSLEPGLRTLCGALLLSPDALLAHPLKVGATPTLTETEPDCAHLRTLVPDARCD